MRRDVLKPVLAVIAGAAVILVALVIGSRLNDGKSNPKPTELQMTVSIQQMLKGIPQQGIALGKPNAPVTLVEFADMQCPWCGEWGRQTLPDLIANFVRAGKLRIEFSGLAFIGEDSVRMLRLAQAAGKQNKLWNATELMFANQGTEGSGYANDKYLRAIAEAINGLDVERALSVSQTSAVVGPMEAAKSRASAAGFESTPSFLLGKTGSSLDVKFTGAVDLATLSKAIDAQLKK
jgi:protein-disulfide isomerase